MSPRVSKRVVALCYDRALLDVRNSFHPDPLLYRDLATCRADIEKLVLGEMNRVLQTTHPTHSVRPYSDWDVPKSHHVVRHAISIHPVDLVIYHALLQDIGPSLEPNLSNGRYSYRAPRFGSKYLFGKKPIDSWKSFRDAVKVYIARAKRTKFIVSTDIAAFYEYIHLRDFKKQMYAISRRSQPDTVIEYLNSFLKSFVPPEDAGVPQNYDPSSYLASAFLDYLDQDMAAIGRPYFRYVDDIKVICDDLKDAKQAIIDIIRSLRQFGLNVATNKTEIWPSSSPEFRKFTKEFPKAISNMDAAIESRIRNSVEQNLQVMFVLAGNQLKASVANFDERLFRAIIWRITKCYRFKDMPRRRLRGIGEKCLRLLDAMPGRTDSFVTFLILQRDCKYVQARLLQTLRSTVYSWQAMHIWRLLIHSNRIVEPGLLTEARRILNSAGHAEPARNFAIIFLGKHGTYQDRNAIIRLCNSSAPYQLLRCCLIAVQEHTSAKALYKRIASSHPDITIVSLAKYLTQQTVPQYIELGDLSGTWSFIS